MPAKASRIWKIESRLSKKVYDAPGFLQRYRTSTTDMKFAPCQTLNRPVLPWPRQCLGLAILLVVLLTGSNALAQNQALKLDGNGSCVELPPNIFKDLTQCTVEVWVKWEGLPSYSRVFEFGAPWQSMSLFNQASKPDLRFNFYPQNAKNDMGLRYNVLVPALIRTNEWIHLAAVSGPGGMLLYANGRLVGQHTNTACFADLRAVQENYIGHGLSGNQGDRDFCGEIDEVRVWNHRRTVAQIRDNMFKRLSGREEGLVNLWNFDDGTANDATPAAAHGRFKGNAKAVPCDLGLVAELAPPSAPTIASLPPAATTAASASPSASSGTAVWWIAAALFALVILLAWLTLMFKRSGLGSAKLVGADSVRALPNGMATSTANDALVRGDLKEQALAELTSFAKESLVQGLYSQRAALLEAQKRAQQELAEMEVRLMALRLPERIQAYEQRIAELERDLETRGEELRELTRMTLEALRQKLEQEKQKAGPSRFN